MSGPRVRMAVLNLRMGGQVSSMWALARRLSAQGVDADLLLPPAARPGDKQTLEVYGRLPLPARMAQALALLRAFAADPGHAETVLHLLLPSPAFSPLVAALGVAARRTVVQYEAASTRLDRAHLAAFRQDPAFIAPRLLLNNRLWSLAGAALPCHHLATYPLLARQLQSVGMQRVSLIANLADVARDDLPAGFEEGLGAPVRAALAELADPDRQTTWCAYVGHAHPVKGVGDLVEAFGQAARQRSDLRLLLALSGDRTDGPWRARVASAGCADQTTFAGLLPVPRVLAQVDALALPYRMALSTTMYPSLLLEADEARCPLILGAVDELTDVLEPAHPRLHLARPGDVQGLVRALLALPRRTAARCDRPLLRLPAAHERVEDLLALYARVGDQAG